ncbi:hypothetical protein J6590_049962 [Homalodisca vitripennis]|nr:hypothetical protein J6590_049962 [Homalodisca vitripennis]
MRALIPNRVEAKPIFYTRKQINSRSTKTYARTSSNAYHTQLIQQHNSKQGLLTSSPFGAVLELAPTAEEEEKMNHNPVTICELTGPVRVTS